MSFGISAHAIKNKDIIILLLFGTVILNILPAEAMSAVLILLLGLVLGIFIISVFAPDDFNFLLKIYLAGFGLRVFLSFAFYIFSFAMPGSTKPGFFYLNDGWCYSVQGWDICKLAEKGVKITVQNFMTDPNLRYAHHSGNITPYDFFNAHVYSITGYSPLTMFFISSLASSLAALFVYLIAKELFSRNAARASLILSFFWPSFILWATQNLKEPMLAMLCLILLWSIIYFFKHPSPIFLGLPLVSLYFLSKIGMPFLFIIIGAVLFAPTFLWLKHLFKNKFVVFLIMGLSIFFIMLLFMNWLFAAVFKYTRFNISGFAGILKFLNYNRSIRAYGNLQILSGFDISNPINFILFAPLGFLYALFSPFPWQLGSFAQMIAVPETVVFYFLVPFTLKGIIFGCRKRLNQSLLLLFFIVATIAMLAVIEGNSGTLFRHRMLAFYPLFIFTGVGTSLKRHTVN